MKIYILDNNTQIDITPLCKTATISGDVSQCARKLELDMVYGTYDKNIPRVPISCSTKIWLIDETLGEVFRGIVFDREIGSDSHIKITAYDYLIYILKSKASFNFQNIMPEDIVRTVCKEVGITPGSLASTGIRTNLVVQGEGLYDIIMKGYTQASKQNCKQYMPSINGVNLDVIEKGQIVSYLVLDTKENILNCSYTDSIENMINRVKIYDKNGNTVGVVNNNDWIKSCGILQDTYEVEEDKNPYTVANNKLHGLENHLNVEISGNLKCRTGYAVNVTVTWLDSVKNTVMYIDSDTHTWEFGTGKYTTQMVLNFSNKMDMKEVN